MLLLLTIIAAVIAIVLVIIRMMIMNNSPLKEKKYIISPSNIFKTVKIIFKLNYTEHWRKNDFLEFFSNI